MRGSCDQRPARPCPRSQLQCPLQPQPLPGSLYPHHRQCPALTLPLTHPSSPLQRQSCRFALGPPSSCIQDHLPQMLPAPAGSVTALSCRLYKHSCHHLRRLWEKEGSRLLSLFGRAVPCPVHCPGGEGRSVVTSLQSGFWPHPPAEVTVRTLWGQCCTAAVASGLTHILAGVSQSQPRSIADHKAPNASCAFLSYKVNPLKDLELK